MRITKENVRRTIDWSSSRYCDYKKEEVVCEALKILRDGCGNGVWTTGSYSERGHLGGWSWHVDGASKTLTRDPGFHGEPQSVFVFFDD
jgi:hypothetical protein